MEKKRAPFVRTKFVLTNNKETVVKNREADIRRWIYHNGKRDTQYHVTEITMEGEVQATYIFKFQKEGTIFRKQTYSKWKTELAKARRRQKELFPN